MSSTRIRVDLSTMRRRHCEIAARSVADRCNGGCDPPRRWIGSRWRGAVDLRGCRGDPVRERAGAGDPRALRTPRGDRRGEAAAPAGRARGPPQRHAHTRAAVRRAWGDAQPPTATTTVQSHLSRLRRLLEPEAQIEGPTRATCSRAPEGALDVDEFERAIGTAGTDPNAAAVRSRLGAALALWRGPAFGDLADNDWIRPESVRLDEMRLAATERWIERAWSWAKTASSSAISNVSSPCTRCARPSGGSSCSRSIGRGDRPRPSGGPPICLGLLRDEFGLDLSPAARELEASDRRGRPVVAGRNARATRRATGRGGSDH